MNYGYTVKKEWRAFLEHSQLMILCRMFESDISFFFQDVRLSGSALLSRSQWSSRTMGQSWRMRPTFYACLQIQSSCCCIKRRHGLQFAGVSRTQSKPILIVLRDFQHCPWCYLTVLCCSGWWNSLDGQRFDVVGGWFRGCLLFWSTLVGPGSAAEAGPYQHHPHVRSRVTGTRPALIIRFASSGRCDYSDRRLSLLDNCLLYGIPHFTIITMVGNAFAFVCLLSCLFFSVLLNNDINDTINNYIGTARVWSHKLKQNVMLHWFYSIVCKNKQKTFIG